VFYDELDEGMLVERWVSRENGNNNNKMKNQTHGAGEGVTFVPCGTFGASDCEDCEGSFLSIEDVDLMNAGF
jgi:hypothetical protein